MKRNLVLTAAIALALALTAYQVMMPKASDRPISGRVSYEHPAKISREGSANLDAVNVALRGAIPKETASARGRSVITCFERTSTGNLQRVSGALFLRSSEQIQVKRLSVADGTWSGFLAMESYGVLGLEASNGWLQPETTINVLSSKSETQIIFTRRNDWAVYVVDALTRVQLSNVTIRRHRPFAREFVSQTQLLEESASRDGEVIAVGDSPFTLQIVKEPNDEFWFECPGYDSARMTPTPTTSTSHISLSRSGALQLAIDGDVPDVGVCQLRRNLAVLDEIQLLGTPETRHYTDLSPGLYTAVVMARDANDILHPSAENAAMVEIGEFCEMRVTIPARSAMTNITFVVTCASEEDAALMSTWYVEFYRELESGWARVGSSHLANWDGNASTRTRSSAVAFEIGARVLVKLQPLGLVRTVENVGINSEVAMVCDHVGHVLIHAHADGAESEVGPVTIHWHYVVEGEMAGGQVAGLGSKGILLRCIPGRIRFQASNARMISDWIYADVVDGPDSDIQVELRQRVASELVLRLFNAQGPIDVSYCADEIAVTAVGHAGKFMGVRFTTRQGTAGATRNEIWQFSEAGPYAIARNGVLDRFNVVVNLREGHNETFLIVD